MSRFMVNACTRPFAGTCAYAWSHAATQEAGHRQASVDDEALVDDEANVDQQADHGQPPDDHPRAPADRVQTDDSGIQGCRRRFAAAPRDRARRAHQERDAHRRSHPGGRRRRRQARPHDAHRCRGPRATADLARAPADGGRDLRHRAAARPWRRDGRRPCPAPRRQGAPRGRHRDVSHPRLRRPQRRPDQRAPVGPDACAAAQSARPREAQREPQVGSAGDRAKAQVTQPGATRTRPERGAELELTIDGLAFGGKGVARTDGYVVFVQGAIPGDRVRAVLNKRKKAYGEARAIEILEPSPDRIEPLADHPGAPWQVLPYERQIAVKSEQVDDALRRIGKLDGYELEEIVPAVEQWRYRNKLEYSFGTGADGELVCGFHAPGSWETILHLEDCLLQSERGNELRRAVLAWCRSQGLDAYDRRSQTGFLRNLVIREGRRTGQFQVRLVTSEGELDTDALRAAIEVHSLLWTQVPGVAEVSAGPTEIVDGSPTFDEELSGLSVRISPEAFFQTNTEMAEQLYGVAASYAQLQGWERVYDLFCGIGTIGLSLAPRAGELFGLEIVEEAVADAIENARLNQTSNAHFFAGDVRLALRELVEKAGRPDVLVVDPPRSGLSQKVVRRIIEAAPRRIVYVSCNPTTLAPNAAQLVEAGYALRRVRPVDMFPQTPHIECVALLERAG